MVRREGGGWGAGAIRMARLRWGSGHRSAHAVDRQMSVQAGTQRHCGEDLPLDSFGTGSRIGRECSCTPPELAANSATSLGRATAADPVQPNISWRSGTNRHAPVLVKLYLSSLSHSCTQVYHGD